MNIDGLDGSLQASGKRGHEVRTNEAARAENGDAHRARGEGDFRGQDTQSGTPSPPFGWRYRPGMKMSGHRSLPEWNVNRTAVSAGVPTSHR